MGHAEHGAGNKSFLWRGTLCGSDQTPTGTLTRPFQQFHRLACRQKQCVLQKLACMAVSERHRHKMRIINALKVWGFFLGGGVSSPVQTDSSVLHPAEKSWRTTVSSHPPESCQHRETSCEFSIQIFLRTPLRVLKSFSSKHTN